MKEHVIPNQTVMQDTPQLFTSSRAFALFFSSKKEQNDALSV
jgi:hypothetical protein